MDGCRYFTDLSYINVGPGEVGQLRAGLDEDLREVMIVVASGDHVQTHQDVEGQSEDRQIPAAVNGSQSARQNRAERQNATRKLDEETRALVRLVGPFAAISMVTFKGHLLTHPMAKCSTRRLMSSYISTNISVLVILVCFNLQVLPYLPHHRHKNVWQQQPPVPIPSVGEHSHQESHQDAVVTVQSCGYCTPGTEA